MSKLQVDFTALSRAVAQAMSAQQSYERVGHIQAQMRITLIYIEQSVASLVRDYKRKVAEEFVKLPEWLSTATVTTGLGYELMIDKNQDRVMLVDQQGTVLYKQDF